MSSMIKRTLTDRTNVEKRLKNDSAIDLNFDIGELQNKSSTSASFDDDSFLEHSNQQNYDDDDDDVFEYSAKNSSALKNNPSDRTRKRLNGISSYPWKENRSKRKSEQMEKEDRIMDQTLKKLREEQARIDAHRLSITDH